MARFGKLPVELLDGVEVEIAGSKVKVVGSKGTLEREFPGVSVKLVGKTLSVVAKGDTKVSRAMQGTTRSHLINLIRGVSAGWSKKLELVGAGYRAEVRDNDLVLSIGFSHPVVIHAPEGVKFTVEKSGITIEGIDKEVVGQVAATVRAVRKPEPYKGKGIKYIDEVVRRKAGKQAAKTAA